MVSLGVAQRARSHRHHSPVAIHLSKRKRTPWGCAFVVGDGGCVRIVRAVSVARPLASLLSPSTGAKKRRIAPSCGARKALSAPSYGAVMPVFDDSSVPSCGHHLEKPSVGQFLNGDTGRADRASTHAADPQSEPDGIGLDSRNGVQRHWDDD